MKHAWVILCLALSIPLPCLAEEPAWQPAGNIPREESVQVLAAAPDYPFVVAAATKTLLYVSEDGGKTWGARRMLPQKAIVAAIAIQAKPRTILLATDDGVYAAREEDDRWTRTFQGLGEQAAACTHVVFLAGGNNRALLGTRRGVFLSEDAGATWREVALPIDARDVLHIAVGNQSDRVYVTSRQGLFSGKLGGNDWRSVLSLQDAEELAGEGADLENAGEEEATLPILRMAAVDPADGETVIAAGRRGALMSADGGNTWSGLSRAGIGAAQVSRVAAVRQSPLTVYAAAGSRVFRSVQSADDAAAWQPLQQGMPGQPVTDLLAVPKGILAATGGGLFFLLAQSDTPEANLQPGARDLLSSFMHEPTIGQVRDAAIAYAEVHPDKIRHWRQQAAWKALLPSFNVGYDRDRTHDTHYDEGTFPSFQTVETQDRNQGMDFSLTWNLSELIWNDDQTGIDTRSKLMVELRDEIVDEITRIYFERRRLQVALLLSPPAEQKTLIEKELRVQELTALLDGLTGGYFSAHLVSSQLH